MSYINITNIQILNNPSPFTAPLTFQITFECLKEIPEEIEWKLLYIGSHKDVSYDQVLDSFSMGPLEYGSMQFDLESTPPDHTKIPQNDILGVTAIILSVFYKNQEFFRVGYYVYNFYADQELADNPPENVIIDKVSRSILADKPRITRFDIKWGDEPEETNEGMEEDANGKEAGNSFNEKMHLFMNDGDQSCSAASKSNPFFMENQQIQQTFANEPFAQEAGGFPLFGGNENMENAKEVNPFS